YNRHGAELARNSTTTALFAPSKSAQKPAPQTKKAKICGVKAKTGDWRGFASKPSPFFNAFTPCFLHAFFAERGIKVRRSRTIASAL
ncbi:MAG: hypothetical protein K2I97_02080, partial [Alistipes sp.]|nr:hypothetical protein [Alistipes sp.]